MYKIPCNLHDSEFSSITEYMTNIKKSAIFLYTTNEFLETEIKNKTIL
jgi:hypothetical protein